MEIKKKQQAFEVALRELTGANPKLAEALKKDHIDLDTLTDIEVIELFWATELFPIYADKSPHTRRAYKQDLEFVLSFVMTNTEGLKRLTVLDIHRYLFEVNEQYSPRTAQRKNNMLKRLLTYLHINQYHQHNLAFHVKNQKRPEPLRREVDFEEIERIAESFRHTVQRAQKKELIELRNETIGYLLLTTGMRASELLSVKFNDVKRNKHTFYIEVRGKRDKWRRIPLTEKASHLINQLQTLMIIEEVDSPYIAFSTKKSGNPMTYEAIRLMTHKAVEFVAAENTNPPHWFRRAYITKLLANGNSLIGVMQLVGHESINTTNGYLQSLDRLSNISNADLPFE
ncbi:MULTISPECIES: tyrosine-type recombinase/integrase [unclassified Exiguobacterium]|uniref:Phage integrase:Phage integrase, N-terminal SAM-like protein n=1 Tax=Exiguobacterium sp. S3-2 TaxID=1389960 RepID=V9Z8S9_9BACL|nr:MULTISPECIES: tyrosine-type recombinase/integrase [unclassified Exiguobacterium]AHE40533.1 Phage integrase:Phage integrase, N-terminal SAM-like protein [Exiguobacterium sp. S3-2]